MIKEDDHISNFILSHIRNNLEEPGSDLLNHFMDYYCSRILVSDEIVEKVQVFYHNLLDEKLEDYLKNNIFKYFDDNIDKLAKKVFSKVIDQSTFREEIKTTIINRIFDLYGFELTLNQNFSD